MELLKVDSVEGAFEKLVAAAKCLNLQPRQVPITESLGLLLHDNIYCTEDIPAFRRSTVDGYAVNAKDTAAASESIPVSLKLVGQVEMGRAADFTLSPGECAEVATGGMVPDAADAVVMVEYTEQFGADCMAVNQSVSEGENVVQRGEDCKAGEHILPAGKHIGAQEIGALAAAGIVSVPVASPLRLAVISTGDELVPPDKAPALGQIRDINTYALTALAEKNGFNVVHTAVLRDDDRLLEAELRRVMRDCDVVAVSGGSSQGKKDMTREVIDRVSKPGVFTHGLALKPGKPTILGVDEASGTLFAGLPGHPVSAMMVFELLLCRLWRHITGATQAPAVPARLSVNLASSPGKTTCWPVRLEFGGSHYSAIPVFGKSGLITTLTRADGYIISQRNAEGLAAGCEVFVHLF